MNRDEPKGELRWGRGTIVSVSRLSGPGQPTTRPIGIGELVARLEVGNPIQIRLDAREDGRLLAATTIVRIEAIGPDTVRISTRNHRYEMRRVAAALAKTRLSHPGSSSIGSPFSPGRADETQFVDAGDWPEPAPNRFETGARIRVVQERDGESRELGDATLLADLVPGQSASFGIDGRIIATSAVRDVVEIDKSTVRLVTGNSTYQLALVSSGSKE